MYYIYGLIRYLCIFAACFECGNAVEIHNGITTRDCHILSSVCVVLEAILLKPPQVDSNSAKLAPGWALI